MNVLYVSVDEKSNNCSCCSCWNADFSCTDNAVVVNVTLENCHLIPKRFHLDILWYRSNMVSNATVDELDVAENKVGFNNYLAILSIVDNHILVFSTLI